MGKRRNGHDPEEISYWQSYSDMMAALLLVFVLIIAFALNQTITVYTEKQNEIEESRLKIEEQQNQLDAIIGIRGDIIEQLKKAFDDSKAGISVDPETGAISFDSSILFETGKYDLQNEGKEFLKEFFPEYMSVILSDDIEDYISEIIIEGHTDDRSGYLYNLELSQNRAFAVVEYCLSDDTGMFKGEELELVRSLTTANGRAYYELITDENGKVDRSASRRVEIQFRLKEDEMIREMQNVLEENE